MQNTKKTIIVTAGEPAGIGTEITIKSILSNKFDENLKIIFLTDPILIRDFLSKSKNKFLINILNKEYNFSDYKFKHINVLPIKLNKKSHLGKLDKDNCEFVLKSIFLAVKLVLRKMADAVVTNPINKFIMKKNGFEFDGHTEFLGSLSKKNKNPIMLLESNELKVVPLTTHIPINKISRTLNEDMIIKKIRIIKTEIEKNFGIQNPIIYVSGLNPHAGENGKVGKEEKKIITPAINKLKKEKINVFGPISPDIIFQHDIRKKYDVAVCMYHDQALIPIKVLSFNNIVNITLGLDFIRTSPDHGTALDIAGLNKANANSMIEAIKKAEQLIHNKRA